MLHFIARRPFYLQGVGIGPGELLDLEDARLAADLLTLGRIEPADARTAARFTFRAPLAWSPATERGAPPGEIGFITSAMRDDGDRGPWRPWLPR
jgi:hypothetical protein